MWSPRYFLLVIMKTWMQKARMETARLVHGILRSTPPPANTERCPRIFPGVPEVPVVRGWLLSLCVHFWSGFHSLDSNRDTELHFSLLVTKGKAVSMATGKLKCGSWQVFMRQKWQPPLLSNAMLRCYLLCHIYCDIQNWGITTSQKESSSIKLQARGPSPAWPWRVGQHGRAPHVMIG